MTKVRNGTVVIEGVDEVLKKLNEITRELRHADNTIPGQSAGVANPNSELRQAAKEIAEDLIPLAHSNARGTKQAAGIAATARAKSDRIVRVQFGSVNPPWKSWQRGRSRASRISVAYGSNYGPKGKINYYQASRNNSGYWVEPAAKAGATDAIERYRNALLKIARKYGAI